MKRLAIVALMIVSVRSADWVANPRLSGGFTNQAALRTTPIQVCGEDEQLSQPIPVTVANVALAADSRQFVPCPDSPASRAKLPHPADHRERRELAVLNEAVRALKNADLRRAGLQALGRLGMSVPNLAINDPDDRVRREAANALGEPMTATGAPLPPPSGRGAVPSTPSRSVLGGARELLEARLLVEHDPEVAGTILETLGRLAHSDDAARDHVEALLVERAQGESVRILGAAKGLEALIRQNAKRSIGEKARERLRELVFIGPRATAVPTVAGSGSVAAPGDEANWARTRRLALATLNTARDDDVQTLYRASFDADWQVRRLVAQRLNLELKELATIASILSKDFAFQVRFELLNALARQATVTKTCAPLVRSFYDAELAVVLRAIDLLPASCSDLDTAVQPLVRWAEDFRIPEGTLRWHRPSHAFATLARVAPDAAKPLLSHAVEHAAWQVRAMAARAAGAMGDDSSVIALARDREPNVRNAAIETLFRMKSPAVTAEAIEALKSDDYQLLRTAARMLAGTPDAMRDDASAALLLALRRLTDAASDTSRDPRVAILERLQEVLPPDRAGLLQAFGDDFDPVVRAAVGRTFSALLPGATPAGADRPKFRYPYQPPVDAIAALPSRASIFMDDGGTLELELFIDQAPVTIARFVELVRAGYYNGLTFHRVEPNFVVQGGSPGASEYVGVSRYMRDEVGLAPHVRGAVGISTRGRDTGDGQIFINLVDNPRLDHQYTVFAQVVVGLDVLDRMLEGAKIKTMAVK